MYFDKIKRRFYQPTLKYSAFFWFCLLNFISVYIYLHADSQITTMPVKLNSEPIIVLFTYNRSVKTREHICKGHRNDGHVVNFDHCPKKCRFSCRMQDFNESASAILFFGEDFYWSFKITDRNRTSSKQRWIFWSWESPIQHPEYIRSGLSFNW